MSDICQPERKAARGRARKPLVFPPRDSRIGKKLLPFLSLGLFALAGCVVDQYGRVVPPDPVGQALFNVLDPAEPVYTSRRYVVTTPMPAAPPPGYYEGTRPLTPVGYANPYWVNSYYGWSGNSWQWVPGRWVNRPRANVVWVGGRYYTSGNRYYWRSGYWR